MKIYAVAFLLLSIAFTTITHADQPNDFTLPSVTGGKPFRLADHRGKVVVLHFLLKTECPYCLKYTREYAKLAEQKTELVHVFIKPDSLEEARRWVEHLDKSDLRDLPAVYQDKDAKLAKLFSIPDGYKFHGEVVHFPALVTLDGQGKELFRYVGRSNGDRMPLADFLKKLESSNK